MTTALTDTRGRLETIGKLEGVGRQIAANVEDITLVAVQTTACRL